MDEIKLKKLGETNENILPRGVKAILVGDRVVFVRRMAGKLMPVSSEEQIELENKHII